MKEIRYYIKQVLNFPLTSIELESVNLNAIWNDALQKYKESYIYSRFDKPFSNTETDKEKMIHLILAMLLNDSENEINNIDFKALERFLFEFIPDLTNVINSSSEWTTDQERAEELVRQLFSALGLIPYGETKEYFMDRLKSIDSLERIRILEETKKAQERAQEVLNKIRREEEEAASKYNRE
ncbi:MAG: hypothetical protein MUF77_01635 [Leptospira sp.]|jgi:hypothetical protein|nr:hypothetical protein [Leptospira sp.]